MMDLYRADRAGLRGLVRAQRARRAARTAQLARAPEVPVAAGATAGQLAQRVGGLGGRPPPAKRAGGGRGTRARMAPPARAVHALAPCPDRGRARAGGRVAWTRAALAVPPPRR